jgi:peptide/nickel transport system substrate-binding protein
MWLATLVVGLLGLGLGLGQAQAASPSPSPSSSAVVLKIGSTDTPDSFNVFTSLEPVSWEIMNLNYDFLFGIGSDMKPTLDLATEFPTVENGGISKDGKVITIHIRSGVKWSDGQPLTADDVAWSFNFNIENKTKVYYGQMPHILRAEVVDPTTVRLHCDAIQADLENSYIQILPRHVWSKIPANQIVSTYTNAPPTVGSGPFTVADWKKSGYVHLVRNPYYWGTKPTLTDIYFETYQNVDSMTADLKAGNIDAAQFIPAAQFAALKNNPDIQAVSYNLLVWDYLNLNCYTGKSTGNPVLRDPAFRKALNYAVDRQALCNIAYGGLAEPGTTILPRNTWSNPDYHWQPPADQLYTFDLSKASQMLAAAGYKLVDGKRLDKTGKPISLRLWATTDSPPEQQAAKLIAGWFQNLGLKITMQVMESATLSARIYNYQGSAWAPDFDMYVWSWAGFTDPGQTMDCETSSMIGLANEPGWTYPEYDKLYEQQLTTLDPQKRAEILWKMQQIMYDQTPWVVITYPFTLQAYNTAKWTGWTRILDGKGPAFYTGNQGQIMSYLNLEPKATRTGSGSNTSVIVAIAIVAVLVVIGVVLLVRRRRGRVELETD